MSSYESLKGCEVLPPIPTPEKVADGEREAKDRAKAQSCQRTEGPNGRRRSQGRFATLNSFVDCSLATILRTDALVWLVLFRDTRDGVARTAQSYIARRAGLCKRTVSTAVRRLEQAGLLDVVHRGGFRRGISTYRIRPTKQQDKPPE